MATRLSLKGAGHPPHIPLSFPISRREGQTEAAGSKASRIRTGSAATRGARMKTLPSGGRCPGAGAWHRDSPEVVPGSCPLHAHSTPPAPSGTTVIRAEREHHSLPRKGGVSRLKSGGEAIQGPPDVEPGTRAATAHVTDSLTPSESSTPRPPKGPLLQSRLPNASRLAFYKAS